VRFKWQTVKASVFQIILSYYSKECRTYLEKFCKGMNVVYDLQYEFGFTAKKKQKSRL